MTCLTCQGTKTRTAVAALSCSLCLALSLPHLCILTSLSHPVISGSLLFILFPLSYQYFFIFPMFSAVMPPSPFYTPPFSLFVKSLVNFPLITPTTLQVFFNKTYAIVKRGVCRPASVQMWERRWRAPCAGSWRALRHRRCGGRGVGSVSCQSVTSESTCAGHGWEDVPLVIKLRAARRDRNSHSSPCWQADRGRECLVCERLCTHRRARVKESAAVCM